MKKKRFLLILMMGLCLALFLAGCSSSANPYEEMKADNGYVMSSLNITIDASAGDRSMRVTEEYAFDFKLRSHGFYRDIPVNSGEKIRNIKVNAPDFYNAYTVSHENHNEILRIRVGDAEKIVRGTRTCTIEYTMITPTHAEYKDALVLNVIGQGWSCEIEKAHIEVILPSSTVEAPKYYYGPWGSDTNAVGAVVSQAPKAGETRYSFDVGHLNAFEGVTVYYFLGKGVLKNHIEAGPVVIVIISLLFLGVVVLLLLLFGRSPELTPVTNFYPPKHPDGEDGEPMDPVDMGYLIDGTCSGGDVTSLIFYFASKGYLTIEDPEGALTVVHQKDLPESAPEYQQIFFKKLFEHGRRVQIDSLTNKMYTAVSSVQSKVVGKYMGKLYDKKSRAVSIFLSIFAVLLSTLAVLLSYRQMGAFNLLGILAIFPAVLLQFLGTFFVLNRLKMKNALRIALTAAGLALSAVTVVVYCLVMPLDVLPLYATLPLGLGVAGSVLLAPLISRRTPYYTRELDEIMGFKDFLQSAEKERLELLLAENPQYYYDILPYANVLGVSSIWEDKFKNLTVEPPRYYTSSTVFDLMVFNSFYHRSYAHASSVAVSRPSSSSHSGGGGFRGGGFSGGGHGGGGGGRW